MTAVLTLSVDVEQLIGQQGLLGQLDDLISTPQAQVGDAGPISHAKIVGSPAPWHDQAGMALMVIHEGARRLEASMRRDVAGKLGDRRGGSYGNTAAALESIVRLAYGLDDERVEKAGAIVARWVRLAWLVLGEEERWRGLPRQPGQLPPACPYCSTFSLRILGRGPEVRCVNPECRDRRGRRPNGRVDTAAHTQQGHDAVVFDDGAETWWTNVGDVGDEEMGAAE